MRKTKRILSVLLAVAMLLGMAPVLTAPAEAADAGKYVAVTLGRGTIGNGDCTSNSGDENNGYAPTTMAPNWQQGISGFTKNFGGGDTYRIESTCVKMYMRDTTRELYLNVNDNPTLKALAQSSTAQYYVWVKAIASDRDYHSCKAHYDRDGMYVTVLEGNRSIASVDSGWHDRDGGTTSTGWRRLNGVDTITIRMNCYRNHDCGYGGLGDGTANDSNRWARTELEVLVRDSGCPTISGYTSSKNGTSIVDGKQLLMKLGTKDANGEPENRYYDVNTYNTDTAAKKSREWVDMTFSFSKPVTLAQRNTNGTLGSVSQSDYDAFSTHTLFTNTIGTGYTGQGQNRGLELYKAVCMDGTFGSSDGGNPTKIAPNQMSHFMNSVSYLYAATYGDFSGNNPIPNGGNINALLQKIGNAGFHDAAGNPLVGVTSARGTNIFDRNNGGYDVIVDAVPPSYTRVGNGISPDILTQLVLNENDTVEFIVSFSEATMTKRGWDEKKTYLMLNNGDKAYFKSKSSDEKRWTFTYTFKSGTAEEASLLKVIALGNDALNGQLRDVAGKQSDANDSYYTYNVDGRTMTDYVGNVMVERANEDASTNNKQIESSISWAGLSVDNTAPSISFSYGVYGSGTLTQGTESTWGQAAKLGVSAEDPDLPVAKYDPEYAEDNTTRPSKGIYRPDSTTGGATTKSGLIFYVWTRSETPPDTGKNYEAIKRYSLTGIQPKDVEGTTYASAWTDLPANLMVANNFSDIVPPESAMTSDGSGAWYLHVWTADMTWDSARQRMQYQKAQAQQYNSGYDNAGFIKLQQEMVETYRKGNAPSYNTAWNQVKATFYSTVYSDEFLAWLKESDPTDMYSDAAMDGAVKKATAAAEEGNIYNAGYSEESLSDADDSYKTTVLNEYINQYETTAEDAWPEVKAQVYGAVFTDGFTEWLNEGENDTLTQESTADEIQALVENYAQNRYPYRAIETTPTEEGEEVTPTYYTAETAAELKAARIQAYIDDPGNEITETVTVAQGTQTTTTQETQTSGTQETQTTTTQQQTVTRKPTEEEAWAAVRADVYLEVYSTDFLSRLTGIDQTDAKYTVTIPEGATEDQITELKNAATAQFTADMKAELDADITDEEKSTVLTAVAVEAYGFVDEETRYTAETTAELIESSIEDYIANNKPSVAEAWEAKKAEIYETVYTAEYLAQLDATGYDRYSELAIEAALQSKIQAKIYKNGYTDETAQAKKQELINAYITKNTTSAPKSPTPSYADSWIAVRESVYQTAFTAQFIAWLKEGDTDMYSDAAMLYAKAQAMLAVADYADVVDTTPGPWYLADFRLDDSNWTVNTQRVLLDNTVPEAAVFGAPTGNGTALVEMTSTISDALSGLDTAQVYFQWVKKDYDAAPGEDDGGWTKVEESAITSKTVTDTIDAKTTYGKASATFTVSTLKNVVDDGDYYLYLMYSDVAGNTTIAHSGAVTVNSKYDVKCAFAPAEAITGYYNASFAPVLQTQGVKDDRLYYAITNTLDRPADDQFTKLSADVLETPLTGGFQYTLPDLDEYTKQTAEGVWYVHVLVYYENSANEGDKDPFYFRQAYQLDRTTPEIVINPDGFPFTPQDSVEVAISSLDRLSGLTVVKYRISTEPEEIATTASGWLVVPEESMDNSKVTLTAEEPGEYYLHVFALDAAGNMAYCVTTQPFDLRGTVKMSTLPPYGCELLTTYTEGDETYAVANLTLDTEDKAGYRYSLTLDGGETWCNWLPYMSMIRTRLPENYRKTGTLQVKFRAPDGSTGAPKNIGTSFVSDPIWATAEFDSTFKRQSAATAGDQVKALTFLMTLPENVTATPLEAEGYAVATPVPDSDNFTVQENGVYAFELTRLENAGTARERTVKGGSPLTVVVDIFDDEAPVGYVTYSEVAPTNGAVVATVQALETIRVKNINVGGTLQKDGTITGGTYLAGRAQYAFTKQNGTCIFIIADEAGNESKVCATVTNIDMDAPNVKLDRNYDLYKTAKAGDATLIASGTTLNVNKATPADESFVVLNNDKKTSMEVSDNGTYEFIVQDYAGNTVRAQDTVGNIVKTLPDASVTLTYVAEESAQEDTAVNGAATNSAAPKRARVMATVTFETMDDNRTLYFGQEPVRETRDVLEWSYDETTGKAVSKVTGTRTITNELTKDGSGRYSYSRTYTANGEATLVFCDSLGNVARIPVVIDGIDKTAPTLTLNETTVVISNEQSKTLDALSTDEVMTLFGGYTVTDNAYEDAFTVTVARSDGKTTLTDAGKYTLVYTVTDGAGNASMTEQTLIIIPEDGLLIEAGDKTKSNYTLLSASSVNNAILADNHVSFRIDKARMQAMFYGDSNTKVYNNKMEYELFYVPGLYREGQLKTIATRIPQTTENGSDQLEFEVVFPDPGWYTIIIRNQERTREFTTFFIASTSE